MSWKTMWLSIAFGVIAMIMVPYHVAILVPTQYIGAQIIAQADDKPKAPVPFATRNAEPKDSKNTGLQAIDAATGVQFVDADLQTGWIPWIIRQASILIGALSLAVFLYAGINLIVRGDNEEELGKSTKMIIFGIVGIGLAAFSYTIIANLLSLF